MDEWMDERSDEWKQEVMADFRQWLEDLSDEDPPEEEGTSAGGDRRDLFAEFAALRQEIRLQNREQAKAVRELEKAGEVYAAATDLLETRQEDLAGFEERIQRTSERGCLVPFLDVRDALVRGREAVDRLRQKRGLLRRVPPGVESVVEGYELAIRRFDRALSQFGVDLVQTVGARFDARTMNAVEARRIIEVEDGVVVEEFLSGFKRGDEVLRPAEVAVNRCQKTQE
jgi:molecular chaperone GrpE (heat shock protein)